MSDQQQTRETTALVKELREEARIAKHRDYRGWAELFENAADAIAALTAAPLADEHAECHICPSCTCYGGTPAPPPSPGWQITACGCRVLNQSAGAMTVTCAHGHTLTVPPAHPAPEPTPEGRETVDRQRLAEAWWRGRESARSLPIGEATGAEVRAACSDDLAALTPPSTYEVQATDGLGRTFKTGETIRAEGSL